MPFTKITPNIYAVGGEGLSGSGDAMAYLVVAKNNKLILIDCGVDSFNSICSNIEEIGKNPNDLSALILTHCHIDHTGSAYDFQVNIKDIKLYAHEWEKDTLEGIPGTEKMTAASWYGIIYKPVTIDISIKKEEEKVKIGDTDVHFIHTPGHTPGSIAIIIEDDGNKVLFGQDIHGPFVNEFKSNKNDWANSMKLLISKKCDILCEGHYGIYKSSEKVENFIRGQLRQNGF